MCGLAGLLTVGPSQAGASTSDPCLHHRGPDATGHRIAELPGGAAELFHTRLAIQDLSEAGDQPFRSAEGRFTLVYNGEIYNYPELRAECEARGDVFRSDMDGEVLLHLWHRHGVASLNRLNGIYALALLDEHTGTVVLARDPLGVKPLFVVRDRSQLWFASELRALERMGAPLGRPDVTGLAQFLTFLWTPDPRTPFEGARSIPPGTTLTWQRGDVELDAVSYAPSDTGVGGQTPLEEVGNRVRSAAQRQLLADVPVALMASGGVDSSLLWWAAADGLERAYTISWDREQGTEGLSEDAMAVRQLQQRFGTPTRYLPGQEAEPILLPPSGDLFADPAYELTRQIAAAAREDGIKVLLAGQGGDELFGGYRRHFVAKVLEKVRLGRGGRRLENALTRATGGRVGVEYFARMARALSEPDAFSAYMQLCSYSTARERAEALDCTEAEVSDDVVWAQHRAAFDNQPAGASFLRKVMAVDQSVYMPGLGLSYMDRAGMEFGVEIRVPWLDLELVDWSRTLPDEALVRHGRGKWLPRTLAAQELGDQLANRPKRGFAAPARLVRRGNHRSGERGHRQGDYFARARQIVDAHLAAAGAPS